MEIASAPVPGWGNRPIRWMLLAAALVAACITAFVVFNTQEMTRAQQDSWRLTLQTQLDGVTEQAGRWLQEREEGAKAAAGFEPLVVLYGRLRSLKSPTALDERAQWRSDLQSLLAPTLSRNGIVGYVMTTSTGQVLADSSHLSGRTLDTPQEQAMLQQALAGPRYAQTTLPFEWPNRLAFNMTGPVILAAAAIWPRGPDLEPGVLILVIDPRTHFDELFKRAHTGLSGETFAVSAEGLLVTASRFESAGALRGARVSASPTPGTNAPPDEGAGRPLTRAAQSVSQKLAGSDLEGYVNHRGHEVIGLWRWDDRHRYGVITEVDAAEAYASVQAIRRQSALTVASTIFLIGSLLAGFVWWSRRMTATQAALQTEHQRVNQLAQASALAEAAVREREIQLRTLLDHFPGYMSITDKQNRYVFVNKELGQIIGWDPAAAVGRHFSEVVDATIVAELEEAFSKAPGTHSKSDQRILSKTGRRMRHLERHRIVGPVYPNGGGINFSFGFDITHAKRGQELETYRSRAMEMISTGQPLRDILLQLTADVQAMLIGSRCSVQVLDPDGSHITEHVAHGPASPLDEVLPGLATGEGQGTFGVAAAQGQRSIAPDTALHATWAGLPGLAQAAGIGSSWSEPIVGKAELVLGTFTVCHAQPTQPDNLDFYIMSQMAQLASLAIERDRTARLLQANQAALREQQRQLQMTIDNMADGFARGRMDDSIDIVNNAVVRMLGYDSAKELLGRSSKEIYARLEDWQQLVSALLSRGQVRDFRCQARRKDGSLIWVEVSGHLALSTEDQPIGIEAVVRDITQRIEFEQALESARNAAQAAAEARGTFLANMSHEIRTPMNAIIGLTELALRTDLTPQQQDYLGKVSRAANSLLGILNDILDFSKIESGRLSLERIAFNLDDVLSHVASVMGVQAEEKGLRLLFNKPTDVPVHLVGDPLRLGQVLTNLTSNACKFTAAGDVMVSAQVMAQDETQVRLRFSVRDKGIGMTAAQMERLFQPFTQADESTTRRFGGTGLGLAICRQLVDMMGGRIWAESQPDAGSDFQFELGFGLAQPHELSTWGELGSPPTSQPPLALQRPADGSGAVGHAAPQGLEGARVLLVEDNAINQQVGRELLEQAGMTVTVARNGQEALDCLARAPFDVVLMDLQMPVMDGYTATARIRENPAWQRLPVLAMTADVMAEDRERVKQAGMNAHIAKPVVSAELFRVLKRWLTPRQTRAERQKSAAGAAGAGRLRTVPGVLPAPLASAARPPTKPPHADSLASVVPPSLPGLDMAVALANVGGSQTLLRKLLLGLAQDHARDLPLMEAALAGGDTDWAKRLAHTLKGVAGTLGADPLRQASTELERALRQGQAEALAPLMEHMRKALEPLLTALQEWTASQDMPRATPARLDASQTATALRRLQTMLSEFDPEAADQAQTLAEALGPQDLDAGELARLASLFDFEAASVVLGRLRKRWAAQEPSTSVDA